MAMMRRRAPQSRDQQNSRPGRPSVPLMLLSRALRSSILFLHFGFCLFAVRAIKHNDFPEPPNSRNRLYEYHELPTTEALGRI
jgi:hypothetical protein